jgi:hypothetical protein
MKKSNLFLCALTLTIIFGSCSSDDKNETAIDETNTAIDENLPAISEKLESLEISSITEDDSHQFKETPKKKSIISKNSFLTKKAQNKQTLDCEHEVIVEDDYISEDEFYKVTERYFTIDEEEATNCDIENLYTETENPSFSIKYIIEEDAIDKRQDFQLTTFAKIEFEETLRVNSPTSSTFIFKIAGELSGTLDFDNNLFAILEGSGTNISEEVTLGPDDDLEKIFEEDLPITFKFNLGFELNEMNYHFEILLNVADIITAEEDEKDFAIEQDLLNSNNEKIGIIKYLLEHDTGNEKFLLYDLDGNLIE